ncbi:MAG TPA: hypothetical protein VFM00_10090 [Candidatus Eisenbacteria bacterium]|nr:hypothetical protein [Candidatus Eisenbacteria bacterium]
MLRSNLVRGGILFVSLSLSLVSCGQRTPSEPDLPTRIVAVPTTDVFANSPQLESRELLIDGRATDIEWNVAGIPTVVLLKGDTGRGGDYFASVRAIWTYNPFNQDSVALYMLVQWSDPAPDFLEQPLITSVDWTDDDGNSLIDCETSDPLHNPANWHQNTALHEDQVEVELYSDASGDYPADRWRWGAGTTDPVTPVNPTEIPTADSTETSGSTLHPTGGWSEDFYNSGSGWVRDAGRVTYEDNFTAGSAVPIYIASKGTRDIRLNRGKPTARLIWRYVATLLGACDSINPVRVDDASQREKTWNPGDYVPSYISGMPSASQADVVSRGGWERGKWSLELRRLLQSRDRDGTTTRGAPHLDDIELHSGRTYGIRIRIYNASKTRSSASPILPLYIKPRS